MWSDLCLTARQWGHFYTSKTSHFLTNATPDTYVYMLVGALVLVIGFMRMNFGR